MESGIGGNIRGCGVRLVKGGAGGGGGGGGGACTKSAMLPWPCLHDVNGQHVEVKGRGEGTLLNPFLKNIVECI